VPPARAVAAWPIRWFCRRRAPSPPPLVRPAAPPAPSLSARASKEPPVRPAPAVRPAPEVWHLPTSIVDAEPVAVRADRSFDTSAPRTAESFVPIADELRALERKRMLQALRVADGVQTRAAEILHMPRRTFVAKMRAYGLHDELD
jgi:hypothetical protein